MDIQNFIEHKKVQNRLLKAVSEDMNSNVFLAGACALGIISKLTTGPYFKLVGETTSILDMNPHLHQLQLSLEKLCKNAEPLLEGDPIFNESIALVSKDHIYNELFKVPDDQEFQIMTQQMLELLCAAILLVVERQCED